MTGEEQEQREQHDGCRAGVFEAADPVERARQRREADAEVGIRVVNVRTGVVIAREGGALANMLTPFKFGVGGKIGSGRQYWSWIAIDELVQEYQDLMELAAETELAADVRRYAQARIDLLKSITHWP